MNDDFVAWVDSDPVIPAGKTYLESWKERQRKDHDLEVFI